MQRIRIHYAKTEPLRYTGNLDVHRIWERTLRRARLPVAYSQGFHPQPKLNQACPLPLGITSQAEMIDVWLEAEESLDILPALQGSLPPGIEVQSAEVVDLNAPALQTQTRSAVYTAQVKDDGPVGDLAQCIQELLDAPQLPRQRRGKTYDLRPLVEALCLDGSTIIMRLAAREGATGRPEEVLDQLGLQPHETRLERTELILQSPEPQSLVQQPAR